MTAILFSTEIAPGAATTTLVERNRRLCRAHSVEATIFESDSPKRRFGNYSVIVPGRCCYHERRIRRVWLAAQLPEFASTGLPAPDPFAPILLKKSFQGDERNFLEPLMRFMRRDVRDHIGSQKNDYGPSYRCYGTSRRRSCPKISICEIFGIARFSPFSTVSTRSGHPQF